MFNAPIHLNQITHLANNAGQAILPHWKSGANIAHKHDGSPVTMADQESEDIIVEGLKNIAPNIPVIAEELYEAGNAPDISNVSEYWLVDPLDGTKEFIKGTKDFTINIGLIRDGIPVFGLIYLPATGELYYGGEGIGAFLNHRPINVKHYAPEIGLTLIGSASHPNPESHELRKKFLKGNKVSDYTLRGSSVKFCMIADGSAHLYPRFVPTYEWDTCAAHAILLQTGGDIVDFETRTQLQYGKPNFHNGPIVTGTDQVLKILNVESS